MTPAQNQVSEDTNMPKVKYIIQGKTMQNKGFNFVLTPVRAYQRVQMLPTRVDFNSQLLTAARITIAINRFRVQILSVKTDPYNLIFLVFKKSRTSILDLSQNNDCNRTLALQSLNCTMRNALLSFPGRRVSDISRSWLHIYESASIGGFKSPCPNVKSWRGKSNQYLCKNKVHKGLREDKKERLF